MSDLNEEQYGQEEIIRLKREVACLKSDSELGADELSRLTAENELLHVNFTSVDELSKKLEAAEAENERLKEQLAAQGEPIAVVRITSPGNPVPKWCLDRDLSRVGALNDGDFLYAAPPLREGWWVSVDESPSPGQEVIAYAPKGKNQTPELVRQCTYVSGHWYNGHCDDISGVTHWMPLPQSPLAAGTLVLKTA